MLMTALTFITTSIAPSKRLAQRLLAGKLSRLLARGLPGDAREFLR
jgi:hypothetical protein